MKSTTSYMPPDASTILERSRGVLFSQWGTLVDLSVKALKTSDVDDIHDLRVASRRMRAVLDLYHPFAPKQFRSVLRKKIRSLTGVLGDLRNIDEMLLFFGEHLPLESPLLEHLKHRLHKQRAHEFKRIHKALLASDLRSLDNHARMLVSKLNGSAIPERNRFSFLAYFSDASIRLFLPIHELLPLSTSPDRHKERHSLRISIKKWRYFLEIISTVIGCSYAPLLEHLKDYQSLLGKMNDVSVFGNMLTDLDLSKKDHKQSQEILNQEERRLLEEYIVLAETRPLSYSFLL